MNNLFSSNNKYTKNIISYSRYVDDTFIIFNGTARQLENLRSYLNEVNPDIQFTLEIKKENKLNFLDLTIHKVNNGFEFNIYRKPTTSDLMINA